jgi:hypothetical protein
MLRRTAKNANYTNDEGIWVLFACSAYFAVQCCSLRLCGELIRKRNPKIALTIGAIHSAPEAIEIGSAAIAISSPEIDFDTGAS